MYQHKHEGLYVLSNAKFQVTKFSMQKGLKHCKTIVF